MVGVLVTITTVNVNPVAGFVIGFAAGEFYGEFQLEPGEYRVEYIVGEVYNPAYDCYESILTTTYYKKGVDANGEYTEIEVKSITVYNGRFKERVLD